MSDVKLVENNNIRAKWNDDEDKWYFVVEDVICLLTSSPHPHENWEKIKNVILENEGIETSSFCRQLKFLDFDNKTHKYESADIEGISKILQFVPSSKTEPFTKWLVKLDKEMRANDDEQKTGVKIVYAEGSQDMNTFEKLKEGLPIGTPSPKVISSGDLEFDGKINAALKKGKFTR